MFFQTRSTSGGLLLALWGLSTVGGATEPAARFTPAQLHEDLQALEKALRDMPPELAHGADPQQVWEKLHELDLQIGTAALDRDATWRLFATVNPLLGDGHLFVGFVDWRADARHHLDTGGVFFPYEMQVAPRGDLIVRARLGGGPDDLAGARISAVNGMNAGELRDALLARVHGDTPENRAALLSRRFWFYYWKLLGSPESFDLAIAGDPEPRHLPGSAALPAVLADEASFERQFRLEILPHSAALLEAGSFAWQQ